MISTLSCKKTIVKDSTQRISSNRFLKYIVTHFIEIYFFFQHNIHKCKRVLELCKKLFCDIKSVHNILKKHLRFCFFRNKIKLKHCSQNCKVMLSWKFGHKNALNLLKSLRKNTLYTSNRRKYFKFSVHTDYLQRYTSDDTLRAWINQRISIFQPARVHLCDGSDEEFHELLNKQMQQGTLVKLNSQKRPNSYLARSSISDTARVEDRTFICSEGKQNAGPTNNWEDPEKMFREMEKLFTHSMRGRTMYIVPFC
ncbi:phosphoenolpyruvate carboxykinase [Reticulomyxa filosa]|uniref:Phosphoenolpyruvate carboxykinase n=1 Tax=Reticulomyxa filosa TaxID=46433 RepID=X6M7N0_RETFI|nr:phosphoenolpyruvate carboxykinase [Reticulomyxa filosa]|eukprot:ETO09988.1 phosphoenolpyruvate carboxykinase [Reticulomyxa filosa]